MKSELEIIKVVKLERKGNGLYYNGDLDLSCSEITELPDSLKVSGDLFLMDTKITKLPDNLAVGGSLYLSYTEITSLPDKYHLTDCLEM